MNTEFDIKNIKALWILGLIPTETLPEIAADAMVQGYESESLIELAGCLGDSMHKAKQLFEQSLDEIWPGSLSVEDALRQYARMVSLQILASKVSPLDGARRIWRAMRSVGVSEFHELDPFVYAASELEDRPEDKAFFEKAIRDEAKRCT